MRSKSSVYQGILLVAIGVATIILEPLMPAVAHYILPPRSYAKTIVVPPFEEKTVPLYLNPGDSVSGYFTVEGGLYDIIFYIEDPMGRTSHKPPTRIVLYGSFEFTAEMSGRHVLVFDNTFSNSPKTVRLSLVAKNGQQTLELLWSQSPLKTLMRATGIAIVVAGLALVAWALSLNPGERLKRFERSFSGTSLEDSLYTTCMTQLARLVSTLEGLDC